METWQKMIRESVHTVDELVEKFRIERKTAEELDEFFQASHQFNEFFLGILELR